MTDQCKIVSMKINYSVLQWQKISTAHPWEEMVNKRWPGMPVLCDFTIRMSIWTLWPLSKPIHPMLCGYKQTQKCYCKFYQWESRITQLLKAVLVQSFSFRWIASLHQWLVSRMGHHLHTTASVHRRGANLFYIIWIRIRWRQSTKWCLRG